MKTYYLYLILILFNVELAAQDVDFLNHNLKSSRALNVLLGFQDIKVKSFEHDDELEDIDLKIHIDDLYDNEAIEELTKFLEYKGIGRVLKRYEEFLLDADITITNTRGYYDILKTKDWLGGSLIIKEGITDIEGLKKSIFEYACGKKLKELTIKG